VHGHAGEALAELGEAPVLGPEVVPPLADAVRLVDRDRRDLAPAEPLQEVLAEQPLGRDEQQPQIARVGQLAQLASAVGVEVAVRSGSGRGRRSAACG